MAKWKDEQVDCEHLHLRSVVRSGIGGQSSRAINPECLLPGTANNPPDMDKPFAAKCRECPENKWEG